MKKYILLKLLLFFTCVLFGQSKDFVRSLREDFHKTFENENFGILQDKIKKDPKGNKYWLVDIVPQKSGVYFIKHLFENKDDWGRKNNSILYTIKAGEKGTVRYFRWKEPDREMSHTCWVGDTITIPVYLSSHIASHKFSLEEDLHTQSIYGCIDSVKNFFGKRNPKWKVTNNADELGFKDVLSSESIHRGLRNETVRHSMVFEALRPGAFILEIGNVKMPIIIRSQEKAIRKLVTNHIGDQWEGRGRSDSLPYGYHKEMKYAVLRVGDIINIEFMFFFQEVNKPVEINYNIEVNKTDLQPDTISNLTIYK